MKKETCSVCGLPSDLCMCNTLAKEKQKVVIYTTRRRYGKKMTLISGIDQKNIGIKKLAKQLKSKLACGGTVKNKKIELQGDHKERAKKVLIKLGFTEESIRIK